MGIKGTTRGGSGSGRGDNPHYTWHPSMGTPPPQAGGSGGNKKPPKTAVATGDDGPEKENNYDNVYDLDKWREDKTLRGGGYDHP